MIHKEAQEALVQQVFKRFKLWDMIIVVFTLVISVAVFLCYISADKGENVEITINGELHSIYPLYENKTIDIITKNGNLKVCIEDNEAYISEADCNDKMCIKDRPVSRKGQTIVCLPLKVIVKIGGNEYEYAY